MLHNIIGQYLKIFWWITPMIWFTYEISFLQASWYGFDSQWFDEKLMDPISYGLKFEKRIQI